MTIAACIATIVDVAAFALLSLAGVRLEFAQAGSFALALAAAIGVLWRSDDVDAAAPADFRLGVTLVIAILAYALRAGVLSLLVMQLQWSTYVAIVPAALTGVLAGGLGLVQLALAPRDGDPAHARAWRSATLLAVVYLLVLRIVYLDQLELVPQEAYYWNYAQHLDFGYLDHPPLSAWLIALATSISGSEFFVRLPALVSWCVMAIYVTLYARDAAGPAVAWRTALLASTLPFFFLTGTLMVPDAPLVAAWAAALYYLQRALVDGRSRAWIGAGTAIGVGMLSKYSMILVPAAAFAFVLLDSRSRRVLISPWAWAGIAVALALFSPVIVWNVQHDWASFTFQGSRRLAGQGPKFDFHQFLLYILIVITPWGVAGLASSLTRMRRELRAPAAAQRSEIAGSRKSAATAATGAGDATGADEAAEQARRRWWFVVVFTFVPLAGFALPSFWSETKLHWTGPIWLAGLPAMAASLARAVGGVAGGADGANGAKPSLLDRTWVPALHALMLGYALGLFYYPVYGLAGVRAHHVYVRTGWRDLREQVQAIEEEVLRETGRRPAVVGLDKHNTADEMAYYDPRGDGALDTASRHLFYDETALMYEFWFPPRTFDGRDLIVVSRNPADVDDPRVANRATRLGPVHTLEITKQGTPAGRFYARVVYGYRAPPQPTATSRAAPAFPEPNR